MNESIHYAYHPTTALFLDDNPNFLHALSLSLSDYDFMSIAVTEPEEAMALIQASESEKPKLYMEKTSIDEDVLHSQHLNLDLRQLHQPLYSPKRVQEISVAVIDYHMPALTGIEFARKLQGTAIGKIMLTSEADAALAVSAFNEGVIDHFLIKGSPDLAEKLTMYIQNLQHRYMDERCRIYTPFIDANVQKLLQSSAFKKAFLNSIEQSQAVEYYLIDASGSFLLVDTEGRPTWFMVRSDADIAEQIDQLEGLDGPPALIASLRSREKLLFLNSEVEYKQPVTEWSSYLFEAALLSDNIYYATATGTTVSKSIHWENISPINAIVAAAESR